MDQAPEHTAADAPAVLGGLASRRKFLKGASLTLPAIVTLHNGTALAATSLGCGGMENMPQTYANVLLDEANYHVTDNLFRVRVEICKALKLSTAKDGNKSWGIDTDPTKGYFKDTFSGANIWRNLNGSLVVNAPGVVDSGNHGELDALVLGLVPNKYTPSRFKFAIAHVSKRTGNILAVGTPVGGAPPLDSVITSWTGACLTSIYSSARLP
ncbi:MAG: hypothetical protein HYX63_04590 [Gammaproteobacteria bacterium]|nr:hypothetical protein [Gammaproteobacteria bacterium]